MRDYLECLLVRRLSGFVVAQAGDRQRPKQPRLIVLTYLSGLSEQPDGLLQLALPETSPRVEVVCLE